MGRLAAVAARAAMIAGVASIALLHGCSREAPDVREARLAAQRYMGALERKDLEDIRARSTCAVSYQWVRGGNVLQIGGPHRLTMGALDSLREIAALVQRSADSAFVLADESRTDAAHQEALAKARLHVLYRNAIRAVTKSNPDTLLHSSGEVETRALRMRVRYSGAPVGKKPADTEQILRMIRAPAGKWIVFSFFSTDQDPHPDGV